MSRWRAPVPPEAGPSSCSIPVENASQCNACSPRRRDVIVRAASSLTKLDRVPDRPSGGWCFGGRHTSLGCRVSGAAQASVR